MPDNDFSKILRWPGYRVYQHAINEDAKTLRLWVRRQVVDVSERDVRDLPWGEYRTTVVVEVCRVRCPTCGVNIERVPQLPSNAPLSTRVEKAVGVACESASARQVARQFPVGREYGACDRPAVSDPLAAQRRRPALKQLGVDEVWLGTRTTFPTVVSNLESGEPLWFGQDRTQATLDAFFRDELSWGQRHRIGVACVDMWPALTTSITEWAPRCRIVYDTFHVMQHANAAVDEVRRTEFFRKGGPLRQVVKGKRWLLLSPWVNLTTAKRQQLNALFALNRRLLKAYLLKESLDRLWTYRYEGAMLRYLPSWIDQLRWQRLPSFQKLAAMLVTHLDGILNHCRTPVRFGVVEAINGNIKALPRRGRGYTNRRYLLLNAQRMAATKTEFIVIRRVA